MWNCGKKINETTVNVMKMSRIYWVITWKVCESSMWIDAFHKEMCLLLNLLSVLATACSPLLFKEDKLFQGEFINVFYHFS